MNDTDKLGQRVNWILALITTIVVIAICILGR